VPRFAASTLRLHLLLSRLLSEEDTSSAAPSASDKKPSSADTSHAAPRTLVLDDDRPSSDITESFAVAAYQLRHAAQWEFLPPALRVASQEVIKAATHQYLPLNNTFIFNGRNGTTATLEL
jgi:hypothetical protein